MGALTLGARCLDRKAKTAAIAIDWPTQAATVVDVVYPSKPTTLAPPAQHLGSRWACATGHLALMHGSAKHWPGVSEIDEPAESGRLCR